MAYYIVNKVNDLKPQGTWLMEEDGFLEEVKVVSKDGRMEVASYPSVPALPMEMLRPFIIRVQKGGVDRHNLRV